jgi:hypothetical protein
MSLCCARRVNYSPAGIASDWRMQANANPCAVAGLERRRKSECNWAEAGTCSMAFRKSRRECTGEPTNVYAIVTISLHDAAVADGVGAGVAPSEDRAGADVIKAKDPRS